MVQALQKGVLSEDKEWGSMWVVFLLASMAFAIVALLVIYIGNKIINAMKHDDYKLDKDINKENNTSEKENKKYE